MPTTKLSKSVTVNVTLPDEIVDLLGTWAARGDMSRNNLLAQIVRFGFMDAGRSMRLFRRVDQDIIEKNNWHDPRYVK